MATTTILSSHRNQISNNQSATSTQPQQHKTTFIKTQQQPAANQKASLMRPRLMATFSIRAFSSHPRQKCKPTGLHVTEKGDFVLVDNNEKRVKIFSKMGRLMAEFGENRLKDPWDVTFLPESSEIAISDPGDYMIKVFSKDGSFVKEFCGAKHLQEPYGITATQKSKILVADKGANCIYVHDRDGFVINSIKPADTEKALFDWAHYVTTDLSGNILITDREQKCVKAFTEKGDVAFCYKAGDNSTTYNMEPRGIAVDKCGHVLVADGYRGCITLLNNQGEYIQQLITRKEGLESPFALAIDKDDQLVITDAESEEIKVFSYLE